MKMIPEVLFPVSGSKPVTTNGAKVCDYISLKNAIKCWVVIHLTQAVGHATAFTIEKATDVAGTGSTAITVSVPIWYGNVSTSSNTLARQTDAVSFTIDVGVTGEAYIIFEIDPATLGGAFDCIVAKAASSSQATNFWEVTYWVKPKFKGAVANQMSFIVD
jgi:hypothetical protein